MVIHRNWKQDASAPNSMPRRLVISAIPGVNLLDFAGTSEVFSSLAAGHRKETAAGGDLLTTRTQGE
jgi:hypothetical protein